MPGGDELPPGLMAAIGGAAPNGMIIDATVTGFTEEGWGIVNVHNILMKQEGVRPPAIIKGYQATPTMVAKLSLIAPAPQQRALFLLGPDPEMLHGTYDHIFQIKVAEDGKDGELVVSPGMGKRNCCLLADGVALAKIMEEVARLFPDAAGKLSAE